MDFHAFSPFPFISEFISWGHVVLQLIREPLRTGLPTHSTFVPLPARVPAVLDQSYIIGSDSASKSVRPYRMSLSAFAASQHLVAQFAGFVFVGERKTLPLSRYHRA